MSKTSLTYIGHGSLKFKTKSDLVIYVDPAIKGNYQASADLILVTHNHHDHNNIDLVNQNVGCMVLSPDEMLIDGIYQNQEFKDITIKAVSAYNQNHDVDKCVGYLLIIDGIKIYVTGDTSKTKAMVDMKSWGIDYLILPIDGYYNMGPIEALECIALINPCYAIPIHNDPRSFPDGREYDTNQQLFTDSSHIIMHFQQTIILEGAKIKMKTNEKQLVMQSIQGRIQHPVLRQPGYRIGADGKPRIVPATAAITYNFQIGDNCMGIMGDHIEPGVSTKNLIETEDGAYNTFACVGNVAKVVSGEAKGTLGFVTGKHGGADHVICYFPVADLDKMAIDDKILIKAFGCGLALDDYPDITCINLDPALLEKMAIKTNTEYIEVGVTHIIPAELMGSGLGSSSMYQGDYDIMTRDPNATIKYNLNSLRFGDIVFIADHHNAFGPDYLEKAGTIGVVVHGDSYISGHGPGVTVLMTAKNQRIRPFINPEANIAKYLIND